MRRTDEDRLLSFVIQGISAAFDAPEYIIETCLFNPGKHWTPRGMVEQVQMVYGGLLARRGLKSKRRVKRISWKDGEV